MNDKKEIVTIEDMDHRVLELAGSINKALFAIADMQADVSRMANEIRALTSKRMIKHKESLRAEKAVY